MRALVPIGRVLFAVAFLVVALGQFSGETIAAAAARGIPLASVVVPFMGLLAAIGGVLVMIGYRARFGAFLLLVFLAAVTLVMRDHAGLATTASLAGGTLLLMYWGSGPYSLDG